MLFLLGLHQYQLPCCLRSAVNLLVVINGYLPLSLGKEMLPPCATVFCRRICQRCALGGFAAFCKPAIAIPLRRCNSVTCGINRSLTQPVTTVPRPVPIIVLTLPQERIIRTRFNCITLLGMPYYISPIAIVFLVLTLFFPVLLGGLFLFVVETQTKLVSAVFGIFVLLLLSFFLIRILPVC